MGKSNLSEKDIAAVLNKLAEKEEVTMLEGFRKKSPFYILISTILSARNRDDSTTVVTKELFSKYKTPKQIAAAPIKELEQLVKPTGFYHVKAARIKEVSQILLEKYNGIVPKNMEELTALPGVGKKTAGCVMVYAHDLPEIPVDIHVQVISQRLGWTNEKTPDKINDDLKKKIPMKYWNLVNEVFVIHGQKVCLTRKPRCEVCAVSNYCIYFKKK